MFVLIFVNFKPRALSREPSSDRSMPRAEVRAWAQVSHGNITVFSHLKTMLLVGCSLIENTTSNSKCRHYER